MSLDEIIWWACGLLLFILLAAGGGAPMDGEDDSEDIGW